MATNNYVLSPERAKNYMLDEYRDEALTCWKMSIGFLQELQEYEKHSHNLSWVKSRIRHAEHFQVLSLLYLVYFTSVKEWRVPRSVTSLFSRRQLESLVEAMRPIEQPKFLSFNRKQQVDYLTKFASQIPGLVAPLLTAVEKEESVPAK